MHISSFTSTRWAVMPLTSSGECWDQVPAIQMNEEQARRQGEGLEMSTGVQASVGREAGAMHIERRGQVQG